MKEILTMNTPIDKDLHFKFANKCKYYDLKIKDVMATLFQRFVEGEFDKDFNIEEKSITPSKGGDFNKL